MYQQHISFCEAKQLKIPSERPCRAWLHKTNVVITRFDMPQHFVPAGTKIKGIDDKPRYQYKKKKKDSDDEDSASESSSEERESEFDEPEEEEKKPKRKKKQEKVGEKQPKKKAKTKEGQTTTYPTTYPVHQEPPPVQQTHAPVWNIPQQRAPKTESPRPAAGRMNRSIHSSASTTSNSGEDSPEFDVVEALECIDFLIGLVPSHMLSVIPIVDEVEEVVEESGGTVNTMVQNFSIQHLLS